MVKRVLVAAALALLPGCMGPSGLAGLALPGLPSAGGKATLTTVSNAELDSLIVCAQTKPAGSVFVNGWTAIKTTFAEGQRDAVRPAIEAQAKALGCL